MFAVGNGTKHQSGQCLARELVPAVLIPLFHNVPIGIECWVDGCLSLYRWRESGELRHTRLKSAFDDIA